MDTIDEYYREALAAHISAIEAAGQAMRDPARDAAGSIRRIAHSLRGSGGTYGYPEISEAAGAVEEAPDAQLAPRCERLMGVIRTVLASQAARRVCILIVEDDPDMAHLLQLTLQGGNRTIWLAGTGAEAEKVLENHDVSLIVLDLLLPDMDGRNLLIRLRERPQTATLPVVVLSAYGGPLARTECLAIGADAFIIKPFVPETFTDLIRTLLQRAGNAKREARVDALTRLPNRPAFREAYDRSLALAERTGMPLALGIFDLDQFKGINDGYGHSMGDLVLCRASEGVGKALRQSDLLARWGGDEFVVLFPNTSGTGAVKALETALGALAKQRFEPRAGETFQVTFSAGIVEVQPGTPIEDALIAADQSMYRAKEAGRNRVLGADKPVSVTASSAQKILLVEDDEKLAGQVRQDFSREGFEVVHFADGAEALSAFREGGVSAVILDVATAKTDGFEMLRRFRGLPACARVPIVALTGLGRMEDVARALDLGADDYVLKPLSSAELLARVRRSMVRYETTQEPPRPVRQVPQAKPEAAAKIVVRPPAVVCELIPGYLLNREKDVVILQKALEEGNFELLRRTGHSLKGNGGSYGFPGLTEIGGRLEGAALREDREAIRTGIGELVDYLARVEIVT